MRAADEVFGLFVQGCLAFAGDAKGLRAWAARHGLPSLAPEGQAAFLHGQRGLVYDASDAGGKFVLLSGDAGGCSAIAQRADPDRLAATLPRRLQDLGIAARLTAEHDDRDETALHWRHYEASGSTRRWTVLLGTASGKAGGLAILSAEGG